MGAPRTGKSYLAKKLAGHYGAELFLEGGGGQQEFPQWIQESIAQDNRRLERQLWFRTRLIEDYLRARALRERGHTVVLDVFWLSNHMYVDALFSGVERELMQQVSAIDKQLLDYPDLVVFLQTSEAEIRNFLALGGRGFDQSEAYLQSTILPVSTVHEQFFAKPDQKLNLLTIERAGLDFATARDFDKLVQRINEKLSA